MSKMKITVNVSGAGQMISHPLIIIRRALQEAGYTVYTTDDSPVIYDHPSPQARQFKDEDDFVKNANVSEHFQIELVTDHLPWGG
jgi:hypothetical protein